MQAEQLNVLALAQQAAALDGGGADAAPGDDGAAPQARSAAVGNSYLLHVARPPMNIRNVR